ncbi:MAG: hypothetical protein EOO89_17575 [Pedobacter sp.]|nr:MAG: hypothetical protein EOO89_17575 [Pedobacter sp.]
MLIKLIRAAGVLLLFVAANAHGQAYKTLTVNDFRGVPHKTNFAAVAYTNCTISYNYAVRRDRGVFILDFNVKLQMNNNMSWIDHKRITSPEMLAEVLRHEQGHYIIAYLQQQELLRTFGRTLFGRDYNMVATNIFNRIDAKYSKMNTTYEKETNHMQNRDQQVSWDRYLARCVEYMPPLVANN